MRHSVAFAAGPLHFALCKPFSLHWTERSDIPGMDGLIYKRNRPQHLTYYSLQNVTFPSRVHSFVETQLHKAISLSKVLRGQWKAPAGYRSQHYKVRSI